MSLVTHITNNSRPYPNNGPTEATNYITTPLLPWSAKETVQLTSLVNAITKVLQRISTHVLQQLKGTCIRQRTYRVGTTAHL